MKTYSTAHFTATLMEHPKGDLLRIDGIDRQSVVYDVQDCSEVRQILNELQPLMSTIIANAPAEARAARRLNAEHEPPRERKP